MNVATPVKWIPQTVEMAVRLGKLNGNGAVLWLRMQQAHDLWNAEQRMADVVSAIPTLRAAQVRAAAS